MINEIMKMDEMLMNSLKENDILKNRIDKAIEYIENSDKYDFSKCELLDILKGSDSNE